MRDMSKLEDVMVLIAGCICGTYESARNEDNWAEQIEEYVKNHAVWIIRDYIREENKT